MYRVSMFSHFSVPSFILELIYLYFPLLDVRTVENKGKLILTEIFPSVQKHDT